MLKLGKDLDIWKKGVKLVDKRSKNRAEVDVLTVRLAIKRSKLPSYHESQ
jgi:hypothetical protein